MIYRIDHNESGPFIKIDFDINYAIDLDQNNPERGNLPFFLTCEIKSYTDVWDTPHIQFVDDKNQKTDEYPDLTVQGAKLFLSEKAYGTLKETLAPHGEFLPVTFNAGTGYIFNPLATVEPMEGSVLRESYDTLNPFDKPDKIRPLESYKFNEDNLLPIFKSEIDTSRIFITKDLYRMIRLNGLKGLLFYQDYSNTYAEPEGGFKGSTSMPGYENED